MNLEWLIQEQRPKLLVFCNGWGMDKRIFSPIFSDDYDVLICSQHRSDIVPSELQELLFQYQYSILISWSMGVVYGQHYFAPFANCFSKLIAVNGTLKPIDDEYGIPYKLMEKTCNELSDTSLTRFYRRTCKSADILQKFLANRPERVLEDQRAELELMLRERLTYDEKDSIYSTVVVAEKDLVMPTQNQLNFWKNTPILKIKGTHFPFYGFKSWDHLVDMV